jgi:hypothetical protein
MAFKAAAVIRWLLTTAMLAGCGEGAGSARIAVRDSAGIRIVENPSPDDSAAHVWWTVSTPEIDIGGADAQEPYALHRVVDALRSPEGLIVVASNATSDIRVYDASGMHVRTTGRSGGGPGEFGSLSVLERGIADSILVPDPSNRRITVLSPSGEYVRDIISDGGPLPRIYGRFSDGSLIGSITGGGTPALPQDGFARLDIVLGRYSAQGELIDTIGAFPGAERLVKITSVGPGPITSPDQIATIEIMATPFTKNGLQTAFGTELYVGPQDAGEILVYDTPGTLTRIIRTGRVPDAVTEQHLEAEWQRSLEAAPPERQAEMRATGRVNRPHGAIVPPYAALATDSEGNLWVSDYDDPLKDQKGRWTIYDPQGAVLARIALPPRFRPYDIGSDWILGEELDDLDVEHVQLYRLQKARD